MINRWKLINEIEKIEPDIIEASGLVPEDCIWFAGHFPGEPILPGIALIYTVYDAIERSEQDRGQSVNFSFLKRIRFTGPVRPGDKLLLSLTREDGNEIILFHFKVAVQENTVCSGLMAVSKDIRDKKAK